MVESNEFFKKTLIDKAKDLSNSRNAPYLGTLLLIMTTTFDEKLIDRQLNKFVGYLPKNETELDNDILPEHHLPSGLLQHKYTKFRMLSTAILNKTNNQSIEAKNEFNKFIIDYLKQTEYKTAVRYILNSPFVGSNVNQYMEYIDKKYSREREPYNIWDFMRFTILFVYLQGQKLNNQLDKLLNAKASREIEKLIMDLLDLEHLSEKVHVWLAERLNIKLFNDEYLYNHILSLLDEEESLGYMSRTDRVYYFYASLKERMFIRKELFSMYGMKDKDALLGLKDGKVLAADFISKLPIYAIESAGIDTSAFVNGSRIYYHEYSFTQTLLAKFNLDVELLMNNTYITFADLERIMFSYSLAAKESIESSSFNSILLPARELNVDDREAIKYNEGDDEKAISSALAAVVDGVIQICLARQLSATTDRLNHFFYEGGNLVSNKVEVVGMQELKQQNQALQQEIEQLQQELMARQTESEAAKSTYTIKEQMYKEKVGKLQSELVHLASELDRAQNELKAVQSIDGGLEDSPNSIEEITEEETDYIEMIKGLEIAVVGGHDNYHTTIRDRIGKDILLIAPREYNRPLNQLDNKDVIVFIASFNNHSQYFRVRNYLDNKGLKEKLLMVNSQSGPRLFAKNVWEFYNRQILKPTNVE